MLEQIIKKLGYNPFDYDNYNSKTGGHDDTNPNPFGVLTAEEVEYIRQTELERLKGKSS